MCEQMGEDPDWEKCPPDAEDFPDIVITAINIFNSLGDRVFPDIGYIGKDFTNFKFLLNHFLVPKHHIDFVFEILLYLDSRAIKSSQDKMKREYDKLKNKK